MARRCEKWGFWLWIFAEGREIGGVYWSVIGHRLRVGAMGVKGKVQEWCRLMWMGVEMWEMGVLVFDFDAVPVMGRVIL
jgi:hypothetical protein